MKIISFTFLSLFILLHAMAQKKLSGYLFAQYNHTLQDATKGNNPWGAGLGLQVFANNSTAFKPTVECTGDIYLADNKILQVYPDGSSPVTVRSMINLFAGASFSPAKTVYISFVAGPSFIHGQTLLGIKPSLGFYFPSLQRWTGKISFVDIINRDKISKINFSSVSVAVGLKLF